MKRIKGIIGKIIDILGCHLRYIQVHDIFPLTLSHEDIVGSFWLPYRKGYSCSIFPIQLSLAG